LDQPARGMAIGRGEYMTLNVGRVREIASDAPADAPRQNHEASEQYCERGPAMRANARSSGVLALFTANRVSPCTLRLLRLCAYSNCTPDASG
jgi:hypothetical protein